MGQSSPSVAEVAMTRDEYFNYPWLESSVPTFPDYLIDTQGRPLAEYNAPPILREGVPFDYRPCPYGHSRDSGSMNASALKQITSCWNELLDDLHLLRRVFTERYPMQMNYLLLSHFANFITSVPGFLARAGVLHWDAVPDSLSGLFKSAQGLYLTANDIMLRRGPDAAFKPVSTKDFIEHTEANRIFWVGDRVCAGPTSLVWQFADAAINGSNEKSKQSWLAAHPINGSSLEYAELKLKSQLATRAMEAWVDDALDSALGQPDRHRRRSLASSNQLSGLNLEEETVWDSPIGFSENSLPEVTEGLGVARDSRFSDRYVRLQLRYVDYMQTLQSKIDRTVGRDTQEPFCFNRHVKIVNYFKSNDQPDRMSSLGNSRELISLVTQSVVKHRGYG